MKNVLLIGTGNMAIDYYNVLKVLDINLTVVGRSEESCQSFFLKTGIQANSGGIKNFLSQNILNEDYYIIIAVGVMDLMNTLLQFSNINIKNILIEKPASLSPEELFLNEKILLTMNKNIFIGYNRRFYSSVNEAKRLIQDDSKLLSMTFEFTEWSDKISNTNKSIFEKNNWFFLNSTHVIDLAFHISGKPSNWSNYTAGDNLSWHKPSIFVGSGITEDNVLFSYMSNWESAGRWGIELLTNCRRIYLRPLEGIQICEKNSTNIVDHYFDNNDDIRFKPGLFNQVQSFFGNQDSLCTINNQIYNSKNIFMKILGINY